METSPQGDNIAVKLSTGEPPANNYLKPELIKELVQHVNGTIVECNTAYGGSHSETEMHPFYSDGKPECRACIGTWLRNRFGESYI